MGSEYKFNEGELLDNLREYIDSTYKGHYAQGKIQSTEVTIDRGDGMGFALGNTDKYRGRYRKKGGANRQDLLKMLHYGLIALYVHDLEQDN